MSRILITGGSGLLGRNCCVHYSSENRVILGIHKRNVNIPPALTIKTDFSTEESTRELLANLRPDFVINTCGFTNVDLCEKDPDSAYYANTLIPCNLAKAAEASGIKLIHISTDHMVDGKSSYYKEDDVLKPVNVYARTKVIAENEILKINPSALIIRTNFFGWGSNFRPSFSDRIIEHCRLNKYINLNKDVYFTPVVITRLLEVIDDLLANDCNGIYNIASDNRVSKYQFGIMLAEKMNFSTSFIVPEVTYARSNMPLRPSDMSLSNQKATDAIGYAIGTVDYQIDRLLDTHWMKLRVNEVVQ